MKSLNSIVLYGGNIMDYNEYQKKLSKEKNIRINYNRCTPPTEPKQLLAELQRLSEYFSLAEPYYKQRDYLK